MATEKLGKSMRKNWFWVAAAIAVVFGYTVGKDRKLRDRAEAERHNVSSVDAGKSMSSTAVSVGDSDLTPDVSATER